VHAFFDDVQNAIEHADYVFCNEDEGSAYAEKLGLKAEERTEMAKRLAETKKVNSKRPRVVICTQGAEPTIVAQS
jgi:adenosine kinase